MEDQTAGIYDQNQINLTDIRKDKPKNNFGDTLWYSFIIFSIFILTVGVPSIAVFLGIKFLPAMILWALSEVWLINIFLGFVPILCTAAASLILIGCIYLACYLFRYASKFRSLPGCCGAYIFASCKYRRSIPVRRFRPCGASCAR